MHNIGYLVCDEKENRKSILAEISEIAREGGDGYHSGVKFHDNIPPFETKEEARDFIKKKDNGWYDDHAVRFYDYSGATKTAKIKTYEEKIAQLTAEQMKYRDEHSVHNFKAKHIGCMKCGSKLNKDYIVGERCPLCHTDLRSETTLKKMEWYKNKKNEYAERIEAEERKQKSKAKIKWLVKYEYHS